MKKNLTGIKLINWHGFYNQTIEVKGSMLVFGENGSGKSTLLDALMFLLTGGEEKFFNSAANEKANRTAESYMRAKIGIEGRENLRNQPNVVSHIATEWYDEYTSRYFIIGVCLEIQEEKGKVTKSFYYIDNQKIDDSLYTVVENKKSRILSFNQMLEKFGESIRPIEGTKEDIRMKICSLLSIDMKRYYELLPKAVAFRPIKDVNQFVYQFLMPDRMVDLTNMKRNISVYNVLSKRVEEDIKKIDALGEITRLGDTISELEKELSLLTAHRYKKDADTAHKRINEIKDNIAKNNKLILECEERANAYASQLRDLDRAIAALNADPESEKERLTSLLKEKSALEAEYLKKAQRWDAILDKEIAIAKSLNIKNQLAKHRGCKDFSLFLDEGKRYHEELLKYRNKISEEIVAADMEINAVSSEESALVAKKNLLSRGISSYDPMVTSLMEVIEKGLKEIYHKEIKAMPFCELLEMEKGEEEWRNAVEGYLNTRRFDLFVPEEYFDDALRIYERNKNRLGIYGVGLVNVGKLRDLEPLPSSLALKVHATNIDARRYADFIMGNIICVDSEDELKNYESSITRTVMVYKSKAARQTKQRVYEIPYIGCNASRMQLTLANEEIEKIENRYRELTAKKASLETSRRDGCDRSEIQFLLNDQNWYAKFEEMREYVDNIQAKLKDLSENENASLGEEKLLKEKDSITKKRDEALSNKAKLMANNEYLEQSLLNNDEDNVSSKKLASLLSTNAFRQEFEAFEKENAKLSLGETDAKIKKEEEDAQYRKARLTNLMSNYITNFEFDATSSLDSLPSFYQEYKVLTSRALMEDKDKLQRAKDEATNAFENNYIDAIRANILSEEEHIKNLNKILSDKPFGTDGDTYRFIISKSKDKAFGDYYDIFKSNENFVQTDLFGETLNDKNKALMNELFIKLSSNADDEKTLSEIAKYCDYRRFMNYDIEIVNKNGRSLFSKISREKSGGETQTPFYVIIAASFDQIIRNSPDRRSHGCLILLDEAFNNMDIGHIEGIMEYFKSLETQLLIACPTERGKTIAKYVDTNVLTIKVNNVIETRPFISLSENEITRKFADTVDNE